jgi:hypothetical protein
MHGTSGDNGVPNKYASYHQARGIRRGRHEPLQLELCFYGWCGYGQPVQLSDTHYPREYPSCYLSGAQIDDSSQTPALSDSFEPSTTSSPPYDYMTYPRTPLSLSLTPPLRVREGLR